MCGIAGIISFRDAPSFETVKVMTDSMIHRGPDGEGFYQRDKVLLGHRRLKIIDLSETAAQPISDLAERAIVTFNGEIYNYRSLQSTLKARGHRFKSNGDSETIPLAYLEWGDDFLSHLHGMFAFALYDTQRQRLILARDRIGIKPLYFVRSAHGVAFASEIKALAAAGLISANVNREAIAEFVQLGFHCGGKSWFEDVVELAPGHKVVISSDGDMTVEEYWRLPRPLTDVGVDPAPSLRAVLGKAARTHLQSDVPLGAHLSGGIDSSSVIALLMEQREEPLHTFSVYFEEGPIYDERPFIERVSRRFGTIQHYTVPTWRDALRVLPSIIHALDEPIVGPGVIPQYLLNLDIKAHGITVVNGGQGGDELFAGYPRHLVPYALAEWKESLGGRADALAAVKSLGLRGWLKFAGERLLAPGSFLLHRDLRRMSRFRYSLQFDSLLEQELLGYLPGLLQVEDRTSMAASIESRVPLLDDNVIDLAASMHRRWKVRGGVPKRVLRDAVRDIVPAEILQRRDKRGLPTPFGLWVRGPLQKFAKDILTDPSARDLKIFDQQRVDALFALHCSGVIDLGGLIWRILVTLLWFDSLRARSTAQKRPALVPANS